MLKNLTNGAIITPETRIAVMIVSSDIRDGKNGQYITGSLRDKSMTMEYKVWNAQGFTETVLAGNIVEITSAKISEWQGSLQINIDGASPIPLEKAKELDVIPVAECSKEELLDTWATLIQENIAPYSSRLANLLSGIQQSKLWEKFIHMPAAKGMHHAYLHGLLEHSINTAYLSLQMADYIPNKLAINVPAMLTAALLHDIGKVLEYETNQMHLITEYGIDGVLMGHLFMGSSLLRNLSKSIEDGPTKEEIDLITHIILSHHGWKSNGFGSVSDPATLEAYIVSQADDLEAKINAIGFALVDKEKKTMTPVSALGGKKFFNY